MTIPEIDLEITHGTLGGRFTTVEGILDKVFASGDSSIGGEKMKFENFLSKLKAVSNIFTSHPIHAQSSMTFYTTFTDKQSQVKNIERPFTLILEDPLASSYIHTPGRQ